MITHHRRFLIRFHPGCYDSCVYFLCASSGDTRWIFKTGDAVKSSPAVDPVTGLVIVGSHDGTVYALNPEVRTSNLPQPHSWLMFRLLLWSVMSRMFSYLLA